MEALPIISPAGELQKTTAARFSSSISFLHCLNCNKHGVRLAFMQIVKYNVVGWHGNRVFNLRELFTTSSSGVIKNRISSLTIAIADGTLND
jgi:hypothetical protein